MPRNMCTNTVLGHTAALVFVALALLLAEPAAAVSLNGQVLDGLTAIGGEPRVVLGIGISAEQVLSHSV